jgi:hypothetical protein
MATNAQRYGTRNLTANLPIDYITELGRKALAQFNGNRSRLVAEFIEAGAEKRDPELARRLKAIRRQFYGSAALLIIFCGTLLSHDVLRRAPRRARTEQEVSANCTN